MIFFSIIPFKDAKTDTATLINQTLYAHIIAIPSTSDLNELNFYIQVKGRLLKVSEIFN